jgi:enamine deaminase RidA (YjgF/YER057c/UK114 family)
MSADANLIRLGLDLPPVSMPSGNFVAFRQAGPFLYLSGQGPRDQAGNLLSGRMPDVVSVDEGYARARRVGLQLLAVTRAALGKLDRVEAVVKLFGMVNAAPGFTAHPSVINGCSDLFQEVFGEAGRHARSAVGMSSLPHDISVEIEAILLVRD